VKEAQRSDRQDGGSSSRSVLFTADLVNSVVLNVTTPAKVRSRQSRTFWKGTFGRKEEKGKGREAKEKEKKGEESEESVPQQKIAAR